MDWRHVVPEVSGIDIAIWFFLRIHSINNEIRDVRVGGRSCKLHFRFEIETNGNTRPELLRFSSFLIFLLCALQIKTCLF